MCAPTLMTNVLLLKVYEWISVYAEDLKSNRKVEGLTYSITSVIIDYIYITKTTQPVTRVIET